MDSTQMAANSSSDFVRKLYKMLENNQDSRVVRWGKEGDSFVVLENENFTKHVLPKHFKHSNFASFVRQLNKYDFHKVRHNTEDGAVSPYGPGAWEFKHPDFKVNNEDALDNIRRKAPAARKLNNGPEDGVMPMQQVDLLNTQLMATQQQLQQLQERYSDMSMHQSVLVQEIMGLRKTVVNHEHVMQYVMNFLHTVDAQRRRESREHIDSFNTAVDQSSAITHTPSHATQARDKHHTPNHDSPASPLQNAAKLLSEAADHTLNAKNLEHMNEMSMRMNAAMTTPPPDAAARNGARRFSKSKGPMSATSSNMSYGDLENMVYPVGHSNGINPLYSEHINNIPYPMPTKPVEASDVRHIAPSSGRKKSQPTDPGWIRSPRLLLVEDDPTCRRIGSKFLYTFQCTVDSALDGLEAVNKLSTDSKYDLILMDIIMPNLDGVSATHLIRQFDSTPIVAMTSNIRSDDISMYFQHGMNDVLPKPFTKEGLINMLDKHLSHLKKSATGNDPMGPPVALGNALAKQAMKTEDSPITSPGVIPSWNSPSQATADEYTTGTVLAPIQTGSYPMSANSLQPSPSALTFASSPTGSTRMQQSPRRPYAEMADANGETGGDIKRQMVSAHPPPPGYVQLNPHPSSRIITPQMATGIGTIPGRQH